MLTWRLTVGVAVTVVVVVVPPLAVVTSEPAVRVDVMVVPVPDVVTAAVDGVVTVVAAAYLRHLSSRPTSSQAGSSVPVSSPPLRRSPIASGGDRDRLSVLRGDRAARGDERDHEDDHGGEGENASIPHTFFVEEEVYQSSEIGFAAITCLTLPTRPSVSRTLRP
jgi:hypothetical protein